MAETVQVTINNAALAAIHGVNVGDVVKVETKNGIPINREWRNRFRDANIDQCISPVNNKEKGDK